MTDTNKPLLVNFGHDPPLEATPMQRQTLIEMICISRPGITEAEALEILHQMPSGERRRMLMGVHRQSDDRRARTDRVFALAREIDAEQERRSANLNYDPIWNRS